MYDFRSVHFKAKAGTAIPTDELALLLLLRVSEAEQFQKKLDETTVLLRDLHEAQRERLSAKQPPNMICLLAPNAKELQLGTHSRKSRRRNDSYLHTHTSWFILFPITYKTLLYVHQVFNLCVCVCSGEGD